MIIVTAKFSYMFTITVGYTAVVPGQGPDLALTNYICNPPHSSHLKFSTYMLPFNLHYDAMRHHNSHFTLGNPRLREVKCFAPSHTGGQWSLDSWSVESELVFSSV